MKQLPFLLERPEDRDIQGCWHLPETNTVGTILFLHGYKGYMDWGAWNLVGDMFAQSGWRMLRINFTHNGTTPEHPSAFVDLEAFAANTYRRELEEAVAVIEAIRTPGHPVDDLSNDAPLALIGHSRGGGIACLAAGEADARLKQQGRRGVDALITWAAVADFAARFPKGPALQEWKRTGRLEVINHRTRQILHHDWTFHEDFSSHSDRLNIERSVRAYDGRMMIAHSSDDPAVDIEHARLLQSWAVNGSLELLSSGGHTFGAKEPWTAPEIPETLKALTQTTLHFLEEGRAVQ